MFNIDADGHSVAAEARLRLRMASSRSRHAVCWFSPIVPMKPHIARELAALAPVESAEDATIFRRTASEVMVAFARAMMAEDRVDPERIMKALKRIAIEFDQPVKVELVFDVIAALEISSRNAASTLDS